MGTVLISTMFPSPLQLEVFEPINSTTVNAGTGQMLSAVTFCQGGWRQPNLQIFVDIEMAESNNADGLAIELNWYMPSK